MSMKTLKRVVLGTLPILGALAVWVAWQFSPWGQLGYVAKQTQLDLPLFPSNLHVYDDAEMTVTAHLTVSRERIAELLQDQRFRSVATNPSPRPFRLMSPQDLRDVSYLPVQFRSLAHGARLYQAGGCSDGTAWSGILDDESGSLWLEVQYPDMAGDRPPCLMDAVHAAEHLQDSVPAR